MTARTAGAPARRRILSRFAGARAAALAGGALLVAACGGDARSGEPPRHVLVITVDTLRADHLSSWLYPQATSSTPTDPKSRGGTRDDSIDGLARGGVTFSRAFAPRGQTFPSTATLFTGLSPLEHGARENRDLLPPDVTTLAEALRANGFATGAFTANQLLAPGSGIDQGFDHFVCDFTSPDRDYTVLRAATQWVGERRRAGDEHLFTWVHLMGPHLPYDPQPFQGVQFARLFADAAYQGDVDGGRERLDAAYSEGRELSPADVEHVIALYDGEVARVNALVALFALAYADRGSGRDHLEDTLLVFAADHGEELHQRHGYWGHSKSVYSSVLHVPLFFRHPSSLTGKRVFDDVVQLEDVTPTVLDWLDIDPDGELAGRSLLPLVDGDAFEARPAFGHWSNAIFTARTPRWRLVLNPEGVTPEEEPPGPYPVPPLALYDLASDPRELHDVSSEHPDVVEELTRGIGWWLAGLDQRYGGGPIPAERLEALAQLGYGGADERDALPPEASRDGDDARAPAPLEDANGPAENGG